MPAEQGDSPTLFSMEEEADIPENMPETVAENEPTFEMNETEVMDAEAVLA